MKSNIRKTLDVFFLLSYFAVLVNTANFLSEVAYENFVTVMFTVAVWLFYSAAYLLPAYLLSHLLCFCVMRKKDEPSRRTSKIKAGLIYSAAVLLATLVQLFIITDYTVYMAFRFHCNSFVINLLTTPGGIKSMDINSESQFLFAIKIAGVLLIQLAMLFVAIFLRRFRWLAGRVNPGYVWATVLTLLAVCGLSQGIGYGMAKLRWHTDILTASQAFPLYQPVTFLSIGRKLGLEKKREYEVNMHVSGNTLKYPLKPMAAAPTHKYNVIYMVAESWRADMLSPDIMPQTYAFAQKHGLLFKNHYSGGVGTRMGIFSMFYGLYGPYWFNMLHETQPPVLMETLRLNDYDFYCRTSQAFTYPEFDRTVFSRIPPKDMFAISDGHPSWQRDRMNVEKIDEWLDKRKNQNPFFMFMFFESPHASYNFPPECAIRPDYRKDFNYARDLSKNLPHKEVTEVFNRYVNASNHLDTQLARVLRKLEEKNLIDSSIIIITGDHGEEFQEKGLWGHGGSQFHEEQLRVPLVIHIPGHAPAVIKEKSSHLDIPATVFDALGIETPSNVYSLGSSLLHGPSRQFIVAAGWDTMVYADKDCKITFPYRGEGLHHVYSASDGVIKNHDEMQKRKYPQLLKILRDMRTFLR